MTGVAAIDSVVGEAGKASIDQDVNREWEAES